MTLQLHKLAEAIHEVGRALADRLREREARLPQVVEALRLASQQGDLAERVDRAQRRGWFGSAPAGEALDRVHPAPPAPTGLTVVATDGSQIYPDRHSALPYYAVNIGSFIVRLGTGQTHADSQPEIVTDPARLFHRGEPINAPTLNARRKVDELRLLAQLCLDEAAAAEAAEARPVVGLIDGSLALRVRNEAIPAAEQPKLEGEYLTALHGLGGAHIPVAGYIARPGGSPLLALLALALQPASEVEAYLARVAGPSRPVDLPPPFRDLADSEMFAQVLPSGARSAVYQFVAEWNHLYQKALVQDGSGHSHSSHFFYLNVGRSYPVVARVEVPQWVAAQPAWLDMVHGVLLEQAWVTLDDPYPYALARADEEAVIRAPEKEQVERMLVQSLLSAGMRAMPSEKQAHKQRARYRR
ncbi:MAG: DNA double-strand break repair nuclease NurA [Chloroflexi bacterium]|nr:DNA double-strand break repair nuclease NurA [Chloroflexota bacterium]